LCRKDGKQVSTLLHPYGFFDNSQKVMSSATAINKSLVEALFNGLAMQNSVPMLPKTRVKVSSTPCYHKVMTPSKQIRNKTRKLFDSLPQVVVHRTHGWTTPTERANFVSLWAGGVSQAEIAKKFAVHIVTVNKYCRLAATKTLA
jgi:hypothetical protein